MLGDLFLRLLYSLPLRWYYGRALSKVRGTVVGDVGGGAGLLSKRLLMEGVSREVVLVDPLLELVRRSRGHLGVYPVVGVAEALPIRGDVLDAVVMHDALHHFSRPEAALGEALRVLGCGSRIYIFDFDLGKPTIKVLKALEKMLGYPGNFMRAEALLALLRSKGFGVRETWSNMLGELFVEAGKTC